MYDSEPATPDEIRRIIALINRLQSDSMRHCFANGDQVDVPSPVLLFPYAAELSNSAPAQQGTALDIREFNEHRNC